MMNENCFMNQSTSWKTGTRPYCLGHMFTLTRTNSRLRLQNKVWSLPQCSTTGVDEELNSGHQYLIITGWKDNVQNMLMAVQSWRYLG